jgi:hypothetical protein
VSTFVILQRTNTLPVPPDGPQLIGTIGPFSTREGAESYRAALQAVDVTATYLFTVLRLWEPADMRTEAL